MKTLFECIFEHYTLYCKLLKAIVDGDNQKIREKYGEFRNNNPEKSEPFFPNPPYLDFISQNISKEL